MERLFLVVDIPVRELKFLDKDSSSTGPKLLLNSGRSTQSPAPIPAEDTFSKEQTAKKLHSIYEKLSYEGFSDHQIECAALEVLLVSTAQADRVPLGDFSMEEVKEKRKAKVSVLPNGRSDSESLHTSEGSQADWTGQYMEQQKKDESESRESGLFVDGSPEQALDIAGGIYIWSNSRSL